MKTPGQAYSYASLRNKQAIIISIMFLITDIPGKNDAQQGDYSHACRHAYSIGVNPSAFVNYPRPQANQSFI